MYSLTQVNIQKSLLFYIFYLIYEKTVITCSECNSIGICGRKF